MFVQPSRPVIVQQPVRRVIVKQVEPVIIEKVRPVIIQPVIIQNQVPPKMIHSVPVYFQSIVQPQNPHCCQRPTVGTGFGGGFGFGFGTGGSGGGGGGGGGGFGK